jgi:hypothetical protein
MKRTRFAWATLPLILLAIAPAASLAQGAAWVDMTLDQALAAADKDGKLVLVDFRASFCGGCGQLDVDVWNTPDGESLTDGLIAIRADTATPAGGEATVRYAVTGLPTVLLLRSDGSEIDRIVGYNTGRAKMIEAVQEMKEGVDPLPGMEDQLQAHPDSLPFYMPVFERYLYRKRLPEAQKLLEKITTLDRENRRGQSERALMLIAKYETGIANDQRQGLAYWEMILDRYPNTSMSGAAVDGSYKAAAALDQVRQWKEWLCGILVKQPGNGRLQYSAAIVASHAGLIDPRFAKAARTARSLGVGGAFLDSIAVKLDGAPPVPGQKP